MNDLAFNVDYNTIKPLRQTPLSWEASTTDTYGLDKLWLIRMFMQLTLEATNATLTCFWNKDNRAYFQNSATA